MIKKCIFCNKSSEDSNSVEHILPESLGNDVLVLEKGIVCDKCNNYIARKIEKPVLDSEDFRRFRFTMQAPNKKGRIPHSDVSIGGEVAEIQWIEHNGEKNMLMGVSSETALKIMNGQLKMFFTKKSNLDNGEIKYAMSRFIAKIAIEIYAYHTIEYYKGTNQYEECDRFEFDEPFTNLKNFVRYGRQNEKPWFYTSEETEISINSEETRIFTCRFYEKNDCIYFSMTLFDKCFNMNISADLP